MLQLGFKVWLIFVVSYILCIFFCSSIKIHYTKIFLNKNYFPRNILRGYKHFIVAADNKNQHGRLLTKICQNI